MPNHVENIIRFECSKEQAQAIKEYIQYDFDPGKPEYTGVGTFDFNKIIPMPSELNIEASSYTDRGLKMYSAFVSSIIAELGEKNVDPLNIPCAEEERFLASHSDISDEEWRLGKIAFQNIQKYGHSTWYEWSIENWGTKWNSYDSFKDGDNCVIFQTAWSAPHPVIEELSERFTGVYITHQWADEDLGSNCGQREYLNGVCVGNYCPTDEMEALNFAFDVWGCNPEDYIIDISDSTRHNDRDCR